MNDADDADDADEADEADEAVTSAAGLLPTGNRESLGTSTHRLEEAPRAKNLQDKFG